MLREDVGKYNRGAVYDFFVPWLGHGLLTSDGEEWKWRRKLLSPVFSDAKLRNYVPLLHRVSDRLMAKYEARVNDANAFDLAQDMRAFTLDTVGLVALGFDFHAQEAEEFHERISQSFLTALHLQQLRLRNPLLPYPVYRLTAEGRQMEETSKILREETGKVIDSIRERAEAGEQDALFSLLYQVMDARDDDYNLRYSREQLIDDILTLLFAGSETTSSLFTFGFYELARHPELEAELLEEIRQVTGPSGDVTYANVQQMTKLNNFLKETLRVYSPVPGVGKRTSCPVMIGEVPVEADTDVDLNLAAVHVDPRYWKCPHAFDPSRFAPENAAERPDNAWTPFASGRRSCIGRGLAMLEAAVTFARVLPKWHIELDASRDQDTLPLVTRVTTLCPNGVWAYARKRE